MHPARSSSQPPHLVPLVAQLKGSAGRHVVVHASDAYLCHQNHRCARKEPPHGTRSCAQPRNDSSKVSGLRQGAARDRLRGGPTAPPRRSDFVLRGQARPEGVRCRSRAADQRAADGKKFGFWAPWRREVASCCPSRNLGAATEIDGAAGALACGGQGLASPSMRAVFSGMLDIKDDVCRTDELHGRVDGVRARAAAVGARGCMHGGKT